MTSPTNPASNPGEMGGPALAVAPGVAGGVAGLVGGAGAGAAAGLVSGRVTHPLGLGVADVGSGLESVLEQVAAEMDATIGITITFPKMEIFTL